MILTSCIRRGALILGLVSFPAIAQNPISLDPRVPPGGGAGFSIKSWKFNGSGCPLGSDLSLQVQSDTLWIKFPASFKAESGPNTSVSSNRQNCVVTLQFAESFQTYAIDSVAFVAQPDLPEASKANVHITWFHEGQGQTGSYDESLDGPTSSVWYDQFSSTVPSLWKPCRPDRALSINTAIRLSPPAEAASIEGKVVGLRFKKKNCLSVGF